MIIQKWMKKSLVILLSILTLGMVSPEDFHWQEEASANKTSKKSLQEESKTTNDYVVVSSISAENSGKFNREKLLEDFFEKAGENSYIKFGERIKYKIGDEFNDVILPKMEEAISTYLETYPDKDLPYIAISEKPASGRGEKIFHIYNQQTGKDLIRFHVRRENPPQQGYWFNFHYHTVEDQFATHYNLGNIYWDRNTPPNWAGNSNAEKILS